LDSASASAAPATDAGSPSDQNGFPDHTPGNSAGDQEARTRQDRGAASPKSDKPKQVAKQTDDDPEWDLGNGQKRKRSEVVKRLSEVQKGAQKANEEAKTYKAKIDKLDAALKKHGLDPDALEDDEKSQALLDKISQERIAKKLEEASLDPQERERRDLKAENERLKKLEEQRTEESQKQEHTKRVQETFDKIAERFSTALSEADLPRDPYTASLMAAVAQGARKAGKQISITDLTRITGERIGKFVDHYLPSGSEDGDGAAIAKRLGTKRCEALLKHLRTEHASKFEQFESPKPQQRKSDPQPRVTTNSGGYHTLDEWNRANARRR
jgi:hypothetical protein